jgi:acetoin utilization deacetylase AcuC-like enzyme
MKKFGYVLAALGAIVIAAPSIASAETVVIKRGGGHHAYGARAEMHRGRGWHRGHGHHDKVMIIKRHRH